MRIHFYGVSCAALAAGLLGAAVSPAYAQQDEAAAPRNDATTSEDVIIVTGYRESNQASIEAKREAPGILDAISQDQIGLLPDLTIADVARRIPGLATISQAGAVGNRSVDAEESVIIRGLDPNFNLTTFDGAPIASTSENDRAANLSIIPPTVVSRIEAVKTLSADLNPHGLSGQLNLVTMSAFDRNGPFAAARASVGVNSTAGQGLESDKPSLRVGGVYSNVLGAQDQFGLVLSASYEEFHEASLDYRPGAASDTYLFYDADTSSNAIMDEFALSNGMPASRRNQLYLFDNSRERASGVAKFEYQPSDRTEASILFGAFYQDEQEARHEHLALANKGVRPINQTLLEGDYTQGRVETGMVYQPEESLTTVVTGQVEHRFDNDAALNLTASFSRADVDVIRNMYKFRPGYDAETGYHYDLTSGRPVLDFVNPDQVNDLSTYTNNYIRERTQDIEQTLSYFAGSYGWNVDRDDMGFGLKVGAQYTGRDQSFDREYIEGDVFDANGDLVTLDQFVEDLILPSYDPDVQFRLIDGDALHEAWIAQGRPITSDRSDNSISDDYTIKEEMWGLYGRVVYRADRFNLQAGLRYDDTQADISLYARNDALDAIPNDAAQYVPENRSNDYAFWLPSVIGTFDLTEDLILRAAYGRTIGRPNFNQMASQERIGEPDLSNGSISISRGNPDLEPLVSDNFDLSLEYYFDGGQSMVSLAGFYKDVDGLIYTQTVLDPAYDYEGQQLSATITQPINTTGSTIYGVELGVRKDFADMFDGLLSGFVFDGNLTWIGSEFTFINAEGVARDLDGWENQPEFLANAQLSYENGPYGAKIAYNHVGEFLANILADEGDLYEMHRQGRGVWDVQARYEVNDQLQLIAEVQNLTEEGVSYTRDFPDAGELLAAEVERGRVFWLGLSWTPGL
ncbi:TonB-dependent receptor [Oceanicaulis sp.]|uniref:TonB-dependent receptor n=1 Tax=Oceanicaulis sp. TaxID=1924941 RepID=UPI003F6EB89C